MKINRNDPPREYQCGYGPVVTMKDCAHIELEADEQITLKTQQGNEYDVARKVLGVSTRRRPSMAGCSEVRSADRA